MRYKFDSNKKWIREGLKSLLQVIIAIPLSYYSLFTFDTGDSLSLILGVVLTVFVLIQINRSVYYFTLHQKDYLIMEKESVSIYKGNFFARKVIPYNKVERVVQIEDLIVFRLQNGEEEQIYTELLSGEGTLEVKKALKCRFGQKAIAF
ncbi:membrane protein YdbS with pleckstrin-like domain [Bacillus mesophilus]|uniref:Uncharacterized protein n=1 Tax=Bacillus mesophilus TaxID=1808955 RepID=A0A6M0QDU2_9BACI|nr:hypothetical protein [Bacillus mesophilus]MBM7662614.1 membrane protein YdbS with pleckstrin-like domain [Bacillus mesophilus]NEY73318.1 hypothetical protein [Bacillus mesophilus]